MLRDYFKKGYRVLIPFLYGKTDYKLFLQKSFKELDSRIAQVISVSDIFKDIVKPVEINAPFGESMLVIAPHQDDEIIGCGGAMILHVSAGKTLNIVFVQDGGNEYAAFGMGRKELVDIRESEALDVCNELGIAMPTFLRHEQLDHDKISDVSAQLREKIIEYKADSIFVPYFLDFNHDHRMTNLALLEALADIKHNIRIYCYEVWSLCIANVILNIDQAVDKKMKSLHLYKSQVRKTDYAHSTIGLNMYHSREFGSHVCKYAEKFLEMPSSEYIDVISTIKSRM